MPMSSAKTWVTKLSWVNSRLAVAFEKQLENQQLTMSDLGSISTKRKKKLLSSLEIGPDDQKKRQELTELFAKTDFEKLGALDEGNATGSEEGDDFTDEEDEELYTESQADNESSDAEEESRSSRKKRSKLKSSHRHRKKKHGSQSPDSSTSSRKSAKHRKHGKSSIATTDASGSDSESGRSSDSDYEMEFDEISKVLSKAIAQDIPQNAKWKPLYCWRRTSTSEETKVQCYEVPLETPLAGSIHKITLFYFRDSEKKIHKRVVKLARSSQEDTEYHFMTELKAHETLTKVAKTINNSFLTRYDMCIWPCEVVQLDYEGEKKWALAQAPFLPHEMYEFCKVEPNSGAPNYDDRAVSRFQHAFAAFTRGLFLIRDWQGYSIPHTDFEKLSEEFCIEARDQLRKRSNKVGSEVLVCIDPVLATYNAHFIVDNATDFGLEAMDEWWKTHECSQSRCAYFKLLDSLQFGVSDIGQKFFDDENDHELLEAQRNLHKQLGLWTNDD